MILDHGGVTQLVRQQRVTVPPGHDVVKMGDPVAAVGATGGNQAGLYFELRFRKPSTL
jgi:septal ring factor EnvC (AmiA/AmiB activator)